uniref:Uncharacterized protein n=1 Tax=viral metagenome TaxID=1070528 RepID=A0A6C0F5M4_9ZZZZ
MNRDTPIYHRLGYETTLGNILDLYGSVFVANSFGYDKLYLFVFDYPDKELYKNRYSEHRISRSIMRGRHKSHFNSNGRIRSYYRYRTISQSLLRDFQDIQHGVTDTIMSACNTIKRFYKVYFARKMRKLIRKLVDKKIELYTDIVSCEPLHSPCIIEKDWTNGSHVIYNVCTLFQCPVMKVIPVYHVEESYEHVEYIEIHKHDENGYPLFKSPHTGRLFNYMEIKYVKNHLWFELACFLDSQSNSQSQPKQDRYDISNNHNYE